MTISQLECVLCSSVLDAPTAKLGPNICTALAYAPELWESPEAVEVAQGIKRALGKNRPTHRVVVGLLMPHPEYREVLKHPMFNDSLPLSAMEPEAKTLVEHYAQKRMVNTLGEAWCQAKDHPEKVREVLTTLKTRLESIL